MLAVRLEVAIHISPVLVLLQRGRVILEARARVLEYEIVLIVSLYGTYIS